MEEWSWLGPVFMKLNGTEITLLLGIVIFLAFRFYFKGKRKAVKPIIPCQELLLLKKDVILGEKESTDFKKEIRDNLLKMDQNINNNFVRVHQRIDELFSMKGA